MAKASEQQGERGAATDVGARSSATEAALARRVVELEAELERVTAAHARELEAARREADLAGRTKTAFLANMSHEIRTPVSAVMGYANLIAATEQARPETREWSKRLQRSAEHLLALLEDVLDLAKIEAGRLDLHLVPTEPATLLEEVGVLMEPRAVERGLELIVLSETELPAKIRTDPLRLRQILVNLVGNAIKYTPSGKVSLHASTRALGERREIVFEVLDTGVGIAEAELERLFLPFEQGQARAAARGGGVGLGLDIARRLARMLGGDIAVRSEVGVGSAFKLTLPIDAELGASTTPARIVTQSGVLRPEELEPSRLDGRTVLVIDDTDDTRHIVAHFLARAGARVVEAASLSEGQQRLDAERSIGLVLTDLTLPDGDGLDLVRALRAAGDRRPIVALTADALLETRATALAAGVDDFIVKPVVASRLVARLAALFKKLHTQATPAPSTRPRLMRRPTAPSLAAVRTPTRPELPAVAAPDQEISRADTEPHARPHGGLHGPPPEVPQELLQRFYAVLAERVYAMEEAMRTKDRVRLRDVAHRVAGSGGTMGHPELTELGRALEQGIAGGAAWEALEPGARRFLTAARDAAARRPWLT